jgi:hypothetical protein
MKKRFITSVSVAVLILVAAVVGRTVVSASALYGYGHPPTPTSSPWKGPPGVGLTLFTMKDNSMAFEGGTQYGCFLTSKTLPIDPSELTAPTVADPTKTVFEYFCGVAYPGADKVNVIQGWVTLLYPGTKQCWGQQPKGGCVDDLALAALNQQNSWKLAYAWLFPGWGGH